MENRRSIVLITVDCLRADHVGFGGYSRPVTPFLNSLAESSFVFDAAVVAGAPTYFSFPGIMASRHPLSLGRDALGIAPTEATIATAARNSGYRTAAFLAGNPYLSRRYGYHQGFDEFEDFLEGAVTAAPRLSSQNRLSKLNRRLESASRKARPAAAAYDELHFWYCQWRSRKAGLSMQELRRYPAADVIVERACSWLRDLASEQFFLWIHLMDPHHPYYPPVEALSAVGASPITPKRARFLNSFWNRGDVGARRLQRYREEVVTLYDAGIYWVDKQIGRLVQELQRLQLWDGTVFALTGDHGEQFLEHGDRYHSPTSLPQELIRVPLLVRAPESRKTRIGDRLFSLLHLPPTLLQAAGIAVPPTFQGRGCWSEISVGSAPDAPAVIECIEGCNNPMRSGDRNRPRLLAICSGDYKLVLNFGQRKDHLFDLKNDPHERTPIPAGVLPKERVRLLQIALSHMTQSTRNRNFELSLRTRLRDLQYSLVSTGRDLPISPVAG